MVGKGSDAAFDGCSFCGRSAAETRRLIEGQRAGGPRVRICDDCTSLASDIVDERNLAERRASENLPTTTDIARRLADTVAGNLDAQRTLASAFERFEFWRESPARGQVTRTPKPNVLLVGPPGVGKERLVRQLAHAAGRPFTVQDAALSWRSDYYLGCGFVDGLLDATDGDIPTAETGIVYIDNLDVLADPAPTGAADQESRALLCQYVQGARLSGPAVIGQRRRDVARLDTSGIWFIGGGRFDGASDVESEGPSNPTTLIAKGYTATVLDRFPLAIAMSALTRDDYDRLLHHPAHDYLRDMVRRFGAEGVTVTFDHGAVAAIIDAALARGRGARGLASVLESLAARIAVDMRHPPGRTDIQVDRSLLRRYGCIPGDAKA